MSYPEKQNTKQLNLQKITGFLHSGIASNEELTQLLGLHRMTVSAYVHYLKSNGYIASVMRQQNFVYYGWVKDYIPVMHEPKPIKTVKKYRDRGAKLNDDRTIEITTTGYIVRGVPKHTQSQFSKSKNWVSGSTLSNAY